MSFWCWHRWSQWEPYIWQGRVKLPLLQSEWDAITENRQKRRCVKCGFSQDRKVTE